MSLTYSKLQDLEAAGLTDFFEKNLEIWREHAQQAYIFTRRFVDLRRAPVRQDDVVPVLKHIVDVSDELRRFLAAKRIDQEEWYLWFTELIVDRLWGHLQEGQDNRAKREPWS